MTLLPRVPARLVRRHQLYAFKGNELLYAVACFRNRNRARPGHF